MKELLFDESQILEINKRLGKELTDKFKDDKLPPVFICILKGAAPFMMGLIKEIKCPIQIEFVQYSSYNGGTKSSKNLVLKKDITCELKGKNVILLDDILDTGETLRIFKEHVKEFGPKEIYSCVLLDKQGTRPEGLFEADFVGAKIPNKFVAGYGLDYNELYRNTPYIFVPDEKDLELADKYGKIN